MAMAFSIYVDFQEDIETDKNLNWIFQEPKRPHLQDTRMNLRQPIS